MLSYYNVIIRLVYLDKSYWLKQNLVPGAVPQSINCIRLGKVTIMSQ